MRKIKEKRIIVPKKIGVMNYHGKEYLGVDAYCELRQEDRVFKVDQILDIKEI